MLVLVDVAGDGNGVGGDDGDVGGDLEGDCSIVGYAITFTLCM